ncbi:trehalose-phosphatase [Arthrobacter russicus]|jgi:trehalose 6-phosphate phosphatase|uniref:Trehalose 6-phosphate phosphatase n=1 Tax=Arthrobacter russicus TaxID=172040 RepID=A0ABU1JCZ2_9MICC|nr:trehalose-phosphatase [Arthrobacter russicus]MDR6269301.1 trehalose 6-phosphate phosphatase [Arthrobacter russicus]
MATLDAGLQSALERLSRVPRILVAMDFDGTMAPLVARAEAARATPASAAAFNRLAELPGITTALISGRALDSLRNVAEPDRRTLLIGSHGAESWLGPGAEPLRLSADQARQREAIIQLLSEVSAGHPGTTVELKPAGAVLHTRQADDLLAAAAVDAARSGLGGLGVEPKTGKRVLEASVLRSDKGQGLQTLRDASAAEAVLFAGDDTTDEDGFAVLRWPDVGVKVGSGPTVAEFRIGSVPETALLLDALVRLRQDG